MVGYLHRAICMVNNHLSNALFLQVWLRAASSSSPIQNDHRAVGNRDNYLLPSWIKWVTTHYWCPWSSMGWCIKESYLRGKIGQIHPKVTKNTKHLLLLFFKCRRTFHAAVYRVIKESLELLSTVSFANLLCNWGCDATVSRNSSPCERDRLHGKLNNYWEGY